MEHSAWTTRAKFIDKSTSIRDMFHFARPAEVLAASVTYCCDFYGSNLWDLYGMRAEQVYKAWNTVVRLSWNLPRTTHTWLVDNLLCCGLASARERILANYVGFLRRLGSSASKEVQVLSEVEVRDAGSVTGRNILHMREEFGVHPMLMTSRTLREMYRRVQVPDGKGWKLSLLADMLEENQERKEVGEDGLELELLNSFINIISEV